MPEPILCEIDLMFTGVNHDFNTQTAVYAFFFTVTRSADLLEVGALHPGYEFCLN